MLTLPEVLAQSAGDAPYTVAAQRYEVMFKDGTTVGLFVVWQRGAPQMVLRAIQFSEQLIFVFKLEGVCPGLEASPARTAGPGPAWHRVLHAARLLPQRGRIQSRRGALQAARDRARRTEGGRMTWLLTASGGTVNLKCIGVSALDIGAVAQSLSLINRFVGHYRAPHQRGRTRAQRGLRCFAGTSA